MSKLSLPNVSLIIVAPRAYEMSKIAIEDIMSKIDFGGVHIFTNNPSKVHVSGADYHHCIDFPNKKEAGQFYYSEAAKELKTDFGLFLEWDAGVHDTTMWSPEFLAYDYIGAPWITEDSHNVGNGGFTIMSRSFSQYLCRADIRKAQPVYTDWDVCRTRRVAFELAGFKWPTYEVASRFAWELTLQPENVFGYHAIFTWPKMIGEEETIRRMRVMLDDPYLITKLPPLLKWNASWLAPAMGNEGWLKYCAANGRGPAQNMTPAITQKQQLVMLQRHAARAMSISSGGKA